MENKLYGKTVIFNGDSICAGREGCGSWATRIAEWNSLSACKNYAIGGGIISEGLCYQSGAPRHSVSGSLEKMHEEYPNADYIVIEGGTNDADLFKDQPSRLGGFAPEDFSGNYDDTTFSGALESLFYKAISYYPLAKIGYIVAPKMVGVDGSYIPAARRRRYFDRAVEICKKWGIPCLDLWENCQLNPALKCYFDPSVSVEENIAAGRAYMDGQHLTAVGYEFVSTAIESWMRTL